MGRHGQKCQGHFFGPGPALSLGALHYNSHQALLLDSIDWTAIASVRDFTHKRQSQRLLLADVTSRLWVQRAALAGCVRSLTSGCSRRSCSLRWTCWWTTFSRSARLDAVFALLNSRSVVNKVYWAGGGESTVSPVCLCWSLGNMKQRRWVSRVHFGIPFACKLWSQNFLQWAKPNCST